jgi:probable H4MPT-linked C1 transfer pathway protein
MSRDGWLGLDVGGANLKYAVADDARSPRLVTSGLLPFELWRDPGALPARLRDVERRVGEALRRASSADARATGTAASGPSRVALTLTAEMADCFPSRAAGVRRIVDAVTSTWPSAACRVWASDGGWRDPDRARAAPLEVAAANWLAPATWLARRSRDVLLGDLGSTTTDLVPVRSGRAGTEARTDMERLRAGELVYTGLLRTPICALVKEVELPSGPLPVAAEVFAVSADVHLWLGSLTPDEYRCEPPDGGARTREGAGRRLARMLCSDPEELGAPAITALAERAADAQATLVRRAVRRQRARPGSDVPRTACWTGAGAEIM